MNVSCLATRWRCPTCLCERHVKRELALIRRFKSKEETSPPPPPTPAPPTPHLLPAPPLLQDRRARRAPLLSPRPAPSNRERSAFRAADCAKSSASAGSSCLSRGPEAPGGGDSMREVDQQPRGPRGFLLFPCGCGSKNPEFHNGLPW